jgi:hypothetical protein
MVPLASRNCFWVTEASIYLGATSYSSYRGRMSILADAIGAVVQGLI